MKLVIKTVGKPRTIGERLLWARTRVGLTQRLAEANSSVPYSMICYYERRGTMPSLDYAARLARAYGVSLEWLATGTGKPTTRED